MDVGGSYCRVGFSDDDLIQAAYHISGGVEPWNCGLLGALTLSALFSSHAAPSSAAS
jgi:hypothetical protein